MNGLAEWLIACIAEDEAAARKATSLGYGWDADGLAGDVYASGDDPQTGTVVAECPKDDDAQHIARWDPARVLAECKAKREIVERYRVARTAAESIRDTFAGDNSPRARTERASYGAREGAWWDAMAAVALPYADRDGYDEEWRA